MATDPYQSPSGSIHRVERKISFAEKHSRWWKWAALGILPPILATLLLHETGVISTTWLERINSLLMPLGTISSILCITLQGRKPTNLRAIITALVLAVGLVYAGIVVAYAWDKYAQ